MKLLMVVSFSLFASLSFGQVTDVKILSTINPPTSNNIQMGDVLNRSIEVEVDSAYQLPKTSFPMKSESRNGIELRDINVQASKASGKTIYKITLSYQVFVSAAKPVVMQLPDEHLALTGGAKALSIDIPAWKFWYTPLVSEGVTNAKDNMQPQSKPELVDVNVHRTRLWAALALLVIGLLGLVYVNADKRWLPFMNGAFAQAHRNIKKLGHDQAANKSALMHMHQAFNQTYGANLFANQLEQFLLANPKFLKMKQEITQFFEQSNAALFANQSKDATQLQQLKTLSKRLRDCERGI
ncbi:nonribosomal peptide synthetase MxaA [Methylotenera sp.]|uniref:nonribosomal peptide synthetase MxaA n=1 Tax=Methylotenera sp. TaxID=2051956 RepID=UPI00248775FA|nr:nonribosomal peptide synthetase MxaA [Methylotenera sp.]MDI1298557.1 nonribosomal peptide synthetase MxaA [Methylotenera sp.]